MSHLYSERLMQRTAEHNSTAHLIQRCYFSSVKERPLHAYNIWGSYLGKN